jgi:predicted ribosome quality control (RQC) complex YloA/Tae2 family protein
MLIHNLSTRIRQSIGKIANSRYIVDKKVISNYYTFHSLVSTFDSSLRGKQIHQVYSQEADELVVEFQSDHSKLVFLCRPNLSTVYLHDTRTRARRNSVDLLTGCRAARIVTVSIAPSDRVMFFRLSNGTTIVAVLFGPRANVLLTGESGVILDSFKNPKHLRGSVDHLPATPPSDGFHKLRTACSLAESQSVVSVLKNSFPAFGSTLVLESIARAGVEPSLRTADLDSEKLSALERGIRTVLADLASPAPRVYISPQGAPVYFSLVPLSLARSTREQVFSDISRAIRFFLAGQGALTDHKREKDAVVTPLRQQLAKGKRTLRALQVDAREAERAGTYHQFGIALMAELPTVARGSRSFDADIDGELVSIPLEPSLSPVQNAQRYFEKAKRTRMTAHKTSKRIREISVRIERLEKLLARAEGLPLESTGEQFMRDHAPEFEEVGLGVRAREKEGLPFRTFTVEGGFEVWAGKNGANNDLLTLRHARPDDLWFHARGGSGSHVVLKVHSGKGKPGKRACEQAASIAAYYSRMRNAGTVAVVMTERRFVRKSRGSPPGTVVIEREKVIFVHPALPSPVQI